MDPFTKIIINQIIIIKTNKNLESNAKIVYVPIRNNNNTLKKKLGYSKVPFKPRINKPAMYKGFNTPN